MSSGSPSNIKTRPYSAMRTFTLLLVTLSPCLHAFVLLKHSHLHPSPIATTVGGDRSGSDDTSTTQLSALHEPTSKRNNGIHVPMSKRRTKNDGAEITEAMLEDLTRQMKDMNEQMEEWSNLYPRHTSSGGDKNNNNNSAKSYVFAGKKDYKVQPWYNAPEEPKDPSKYMDLSATTTTTPPMSSVTEQDASTTASSEPLRPTWSSAAHEVRFQTKKMSLPDSLVVPTERLSFHLPPDDVEEDMITTPVVSSSIAQYLRPMDSSTILSTTNNAIEQEYYDSSINSNNPASTVKWLETMVEPNLVVVDNGTTPNTNSMLLEEMEVVNDGTTTTSSSSSDNSNIVTWNNHHNILQNDDDDNNNIVAFPEDVPLSDAFVTGANWNYDMKQGRLIDYHGSTTTTCIVQPTEENIIVEDGSDPFVVTELEQVDQPTPQHPVILAELNTPPDWEADRADKDRLADQLKDAQLVIRSLTAEQAQWTLRQREYELQIEQLEQSLRKQVETLSKERTIAHEELALVQTKSQAELHAVTSALEQKLADAALVWEKKLISAQAVVDQLALAMKQQEYEQQKEYEQQQQQQLLASETEQSSRTALLHPSQPDEEVLMESSLVPVVNDEMIQAAAAVSVPVDLTTTTTSNTAVVVTTERIGVRRTLKNTFGAVKGVIGTVVLPFKRNAKRNPPESASSSFHTLGEAATTAEDSMEEIIPKAAAVVETVAGDERLFEVRSTDTAKDSCSDNINVSAKVITEDDTEDESSKRSA